MAAVACLLAVGFPKAHSADLGAIWMIGDSITQSNADGSSTSSPRTSLYNLLTDAGHTFTYTGHHTRNTDGLPSTGSSAANNLYHYHSGVSGIRIGAASGNPGVTPNLNTYWQTGRLDLVKPDIILIMLGTNDVGNSDFVDNAPDRLESMIETIYDLPGIGSPTIYLASIPPNGRSAVNRANVINFNSFVSGIVYRFQDSGRDIHYVDQFTPLDENFDAHMSPDLLHPNAAGNDVIAQTWFDAITNDVTIDGVVSSNDGAYSSSASSGDLINARSSSLESGPIFSSEPFFGAAATNDGTDGINNGVDGITFWLGSTAGRTHSISYELDTSLNRQGYDISSIQTIHGWGENSGNQKNQNYTVAVSTVNDSDYKTLATVAYLPLSSAISSASTRVTLTNNDTGVLATNVERIRFTYTVPGTAGAQPSPAIREIDVIGEPSREVNVVQIRKRNALGYTINGANGAADGQNITLWAYINGHPNLSWEEIDRGNGYYSYQKYATDFSITGGDGGARHQNVFLVRTDASDLNQQWRKVSMGNGYFQLQKRSDTGFALNGGNGGARGQNVTLWPARSTSHNLQWLIEYK